MIYANPNNDGTQMAVNARDRPETAKLTLFSKPKSTTLMSQGDSVNGFRTNGNQAPGVEPFDPLAEEGRGVAGEGEGEREQAQALRNANIGLDAPSFGPARLCAD